MVVVEHSVLEHSVPERAVASKQPYIVCQSNNWQLELLWDLPKNGASLAVQ